MKFVDFFYFMISIIVVRTATNKNEILQKQTILPKVLVIW